MKRFASILLTAATLAAPLSASASNPVVRRDTRWFDARIVDGGKKLDVTGRVIAGTIEKDVAVRQMQTVDGRKVPLHAAFDKNMDKLEQHCTLSRGADGLSKLECRYQPGKVRVFPTISQ